MPILKRLFSAILVALALFSSGCAMTFDRGPNLEPFEVTNIEVACVESQSVAMENGTIVTRHFNVKRIQLVVAKTCRGPLDGVSVNVCQLIGSEGERRWPQGTATVDVRHFNDGDTRYTFTAWLDERSLVNQDIIIEVRAGGQWADIIFTPVNPAAYDIHKQTPRAFYDRYYESWSRRYGVRYCHDGKQRVSVTSADIRG